MKMEACKSGRCIMCGRMLQNPVYSMEHVPSLVQNMAESKQDALDQKVDLLLYQCAFCGLVQFDCEPVYYYKDVVRAGGLSAHMRELRRTQFDHLVKDYHLEGGKIVEIGCGKGEFLSVLQEYDVSAYGIETDGNLVECARTSGINVDQVYSDDNWQDERGPFDAFISFNYLEHQPDPNLLVRGIYQNTTENAIGLVTVPSFEYFIEKGAYYEFMRDHIAYYTEQSLKLLFENNGFEILETSRVDGDTTQVIVRKRKALNLPDFNGQQETIEQKINTYLTENNIQRYAIWGASHQGLTLLSTLNLVKDAEYIVDSAPHKWNKYSPVSGLLIRKPEDFYQDDVELVIIMAPTFAREISNNIVKNCNIKNILAIRDADVVNMMEY